MEGIYKIILGFCILVMVISTALALIDSNSLRSEVTLNKTMELEYTRGWYANQAYMQQSFIQQLNRDGYITMTLPINDSDTVTVRLGVIG